MFLLEQLAPRAWRAASSRRGLARASLCGVVLAGCVSACGKNVILDFNDAGTGGGPTAGAGGGGSGGAGGNPGLAGFGGIAGTGQAGHAGTAGAGGSSGSGGAPDVPDAGARDAGDAGVDASS